MKTTITKFEKFWFVNFGFVSCLLLCSMRIGWSFDETKKSIENIIKSAESGDVESQYTLARYYLSHRSPKNDEYASKWLKIAANHGLPKAQRALGECFENGVAVPKDLTQAILWYERATVGGDSDAQLNLGILYLGSISENNLEKAYTYFRKAAEAGNVEAQFHVGSCLLYGNGVEKNSRDAVKWLLKSSSANNSSAQFALAECYRYGDGIEQNDNNAFDLYLKAADQGNCEAMFNIGVCYDYAIGVSEDKVKAFDCYKKASERGHVESQYHLGFAYANGRGVHKSNVLAYMWLDVSAQGGFTKASEYRDKIAALMSKDDIENAKKLVSPLKGVNIPSQNQ